MNKAKHLVFVALTCMLLFSEADCARGAGAATAGQSADYALEVLDRVLAHMSLPAGASGSVRVRLALDGNGNLQACRTVRASAGGGLDKAVCAAARAAQPFGAPPYGLAEDIYLAVWQGAATRQGGEAAAQEAGQAAAHGASSISQQPHGQGVQLNAEQRQYLNVITHQIRDSIYIPVQTPRGSYQVRARVEIGSSGKLGTATIIQGSGDQTLDKYVLQGIRRAAKVKAPPKGLAPAVDLTFRLVRS